MTKDVARPSNHAPRSRCSLWCPRAASPRERAEGPPVPPRSSAHGADCQREPQAPSLLASPGERRSPELAAHSAANVRGRRECLARSVRQDSASSPAETWLAGRYLFEHRRSSVVRPIGRCRACPRTGPTGRSRSAPTRFGRGPHAARGAFGGVVVTTDVRRGLSTERRRGQVPPP